MNKASISVQQPIVVYTTEDGLVRLDVKVENDSVWLTKAQMAELFGRDRTVIGRHIVNVYSEGEQVKEITCAKFAHMGTEQDQEYTPEYFNLDVIISVGYRVHSLQGVRFRQWATAVLKNYLLNGYAFAQRFERIEHRLANVEEQQQVLSLEMHGALPPHEGVFFDGQIFDAYMFATDLIRNAKNRVVLIDNYVDESVLTMLDKRLEKVQATIYTDRIGTQLGLDLEKHNAQYAPIEIIVYKCSHDRFLLIDDEMYHLGASLKDLGKKLFAFSKMNTLSANELIDRLNQN